MRTGTCTEVLSGDTVLLDGGKVRLRYSNVWAPAPGASLGDAALAYNCELVLGRTLHYEPNGHIHWDAAGIVADVYVDGVWLNQALRSWLGERLGTPQWIEGVPVPEHTDPPAP